MKRNNSKKFNPFNLFTVLAMTIAVLISAHSIKAYGGNVSLTGYGAATVDGVMSDNEWQSAGVGRFNANLHGGGTAPATFYVMNDEANLYMALKVEGLDPNNFYALNGDVRFDNDHDGVAEAGDDALYFRYANGVSRFFDASKVACNGGFVICEKFDTDDGGTADGAKSITFSDGVAFMEIRHPLDSADDAHDFSLRAGDTVGFHLYTVLWNSNSTWAVTYLPDSRINDVAHYGDIIIARPPVTAMTIDVKPNDSDNSVNPRAHGRISVAVLTTDTFNAADINVSTVRFGAAGTEASALHSSFEDVDADGDLDLILQFAVQRTGINCSTTSAVLTGETFGGQRISAGDAVRAVGCR